MPFIRRPTHWLVTGAFAAAFWLTLRVMAASPVPAPVQLELAGAEDVRDPALEVMIARFAAEARMNRTGGQPH